MLKLATGILLFIGQIAFLQGDTAFIEHNPVMAVDGWDFSDVSSEKPAFLLTDDSTLIEYDVVMLSDEEELPYAYTSEIVTPVCDDTLCALMNIRVYWNLLGNYVGFDTVAGKPLTKNDHIEFRNNDYVKLHNLLMDDNSIIKRKAKKELFDREKNRVSELVDAVTGATAKEVKEAVVDGALYSCYTLYHIVHGPLSDSIQSDMERHFNTSLQEKLLGSQHADYQLYALKSLNKSDFMSYQDRIIELINGAIPLNRIYIMKKMPAEMWRNVDFQLDIVKGFEDFDVNSRTHLLNYIYKSDVINFKSIVELAKYLFLMTRNQVKVYVRILTKEKSKVSPEELELIKDMLKGVNTQHGYLFNDLTW
ncbi:hypothetical protein [Membranihabitans maritimus]|uniref:hypothetical protein n=1 Tax=Membranihabitans maritimus TaxID=2904244 RepID=UPI001F287AED|nr:hypothetical protein [Membranihabitans maritimus]